MVVAIGETLSSFIRKVTIHTSLPLTEQPRGRREGVLLGIPDMRYLLPRFGLEYDGSYHSQPEQHTADLTRENRLLLGDMPLLRYSARDVFEMPHRICREVEVMLRGRR